MDIASLVDLLVGPGALGLIVFIIVWKGIPMLDNFLKSYINRMDRIVESHERDRAAWLDSLDKINELTSQQIQRLDTRLDDVQMSLDCMENTLKTVSRTLAKTVPPEDTE